MEWHEEDEVSWFFSFLVSIQMLRIVAEINCEKERDARLVLGKEGFRIDDITRRVNDHMYTLFQRQLGVQILVKCRNKVVDISR